ncbi:potassium channel family protein [Curtobacterium sp. ZW137]|uniref:potassium channel family protein n=1 Tax=Curtobacterium sp. ZW137 TaxID=2485104 RepID=UPI000F4D0913|nr:potassium channel family protein [Curtobacterium sp. ZW137]ROP64858.1 voltage-gated potassium channel [Curtobacterium sp. ZW137]
MRRPEAQTMLQARSRWERRTGWPLAGLSLFFICAYSFLVLFPRASGSASTALEVSLGVVVAALVADVVIRLVLTPRGSRFDFVVHHPVDVLAVALPLFRAFRAVRLVERIPLPSSRDAVRVRVLLSAVSYATLFMYFIALATLQAERGAPGATITDLGTALWWASVTIATVGYGDTYPVTVLGRLLAVVLMAGGVVIVGTATALILSWLGDHLAPHD